MASKLSIYNNALLYLDERKLASLAENREPRRALDDAWDSAVYFCLEQGFWNFAMRVVQMDSSASVDPAFGYDYAFAKPSDVIRLYRLSSEENITEALNEFNDEAGYWYADIDPMWAKYVSSDTAYGRDLSLWPETFADYVATRLAARTCGRITGSDSRMELLLKLEKRAKKDALSKDAMNEGIITPPAGTWVRARLGDRSRGRRWSGETV